MVKGVGSPNTTCLLGGGWGFQYEALATLFYLSSRPRAKASRGLEPSCGTQCRIIQGAEESITSGIGLPWEHFNIHKLHSMEGDIQGKEGECGVWIPRDESLRFNNNLHQDWIYPYFLGSPQFQTKISD